jgi:protease I
MHKKVALVIAFNGYHPIEYLVPKKILEHGGYKVITASDKKGSAIAKDGSHTKVDLLFSELDITTLDGLVIIGGPGAQEHLDTDALYAVIQKAVMADKIVGAICYSTRILAKAGALVSKQATGWDGDGELKSIFDAHAALLNTAGVVQDGKIVTARGPADAEKFGHALVELL